MDVVGLCTVVRDEHGMYLYGAMSSRIFVTLAHSANVNLYVVVFCMVEIKQATQIILALASIFFSPPSEAMYESTHATTALYITLVKYSNGCTLCTLKRTTIRHTMYVVVMNTVGQF